MKRPTNSRQLQENNSENNELSRSKMETPTKKNQKHQMYSIKLKIATEAG